MSTVKIAFPTDGDQGLVENLSLHFGHAQTYTVVTWDSDGEAVTAVDIIQNYGHEEGGCMSSVMLLKNSGADAVVLGGIGMRPLMGFRQVGVTPYSGFAGTVKENLDAYLESKLQEMTVASCQHHT
ncbi:MAG TPA: NifB/NifX family molybdenum-iron cluster-binding protein [Candidatus Lokiarchaeia archaeon]|nr:NifB/NifX family molybdenum-iron cluster-binding protein [Candidatus Lokiarchaeia archaeon]